MTRQSKQVNEDQAGALSENFYLLQKKILFFKFIVISAMAALQFKLWLMVFH